jgi:hypothetical protein
LLQSSAGGAYNRLMRPALFGTAVGLAIAVTGVSRAHHSFASIYDQSQDRTLRGVVSEFRFVNPHPFLFVTVAPHAGVATGEQTWRGELDNRFELAEIGVTKDTFRPGDVVVVSGSPARDGSQTFYLWKLERPVDGLRYEQIGGTPYLRFRAR